MAQRTLVAAISLAAVLALLGGASQSVEAREWHQVGTSSNGSAEPLAAIPMGAVKYYKDKCLVCHGVSGKGDGEGSKQLQPKPRSFADREWQKSVSDQKIRDVTLKGGPAVGMSAAMPAHPDLKSNQEVLEGIVALVRAFAKQQ